MFRAVQRGAHGGDVRRDAGRGLVVDEEHGAELVGRVHPQAALDLVGGRPRAVRAKPVEKWPLTTPSARSPGESVLTRAASQAPVPEPG